MPAFLPITTVRSLAIPLLRDNVDTDAIIPSREIKSVSKTGLTAGMFAFWRYTDVDARVPNPDFVLNDPAFTGAQIMLAGRNFGCGSSREHAAWALVEYGIRVIIAPSFNPIFNGNCIRNGILPVVMDEGQIAALAQAGGETVVDLQASTVVGSDGVTRSFTLPDEARLMLLEGLDSIDLTLKHDAAIRAFVAQDRAARPWIYLDEGTAQ